MTVPESEFDLGKAVQAVRDQLMAAAALGADEKVAFEVGPITLEFTVEFRADTATKAGVRAWVLSAEASATSSHKDTHKVSLVLNPKDATTGGKLLVGNEGKVDTSNFGAAG